MENAGLLSRRSRVTMDTLSPSFGVDKLRSWTISICMGYTSITICYVVSELMLNAMNLNPPYSWRSRTFEQVFVYILGFGTVNCWRVVWYVEDIYLPPGEIRHPWHTLIKLDYTKKAINQSRTSCEAPGLWLFCICPREWTSRDPNSGVILFFSESEFNLSRSKFWSHSVFQYPWPSMLTPLPSPPR